MNTPQPFGTVLDGAGQPPSTLSTAFLREQIRHHRLVVLRGFAPLAREAFLDFAQAVGEAPALAWAFGPVMELREDPAAKNYLFTREAVPYHWDGAFHRVPKLLFFHCLQAPDAGAGGETLYVDSTRLWRSASAEERARWRGLRLTYETEKLAHYGGRVTVPMVDVHPESGETIVRFAEPVTSSLNPVWLTIEGLAPAEIEPFLAGMRERLYSEQFCVAHRWRAGDYVIADNYALLHGRRAFGDRSPRHLRRVQTL